MKDGFTSFNIRDDEELVEDFTTNYVDVGETKELDDIVGETIGKSRAGFGR